MTTQGQLTEIVDNQGFYAFVPFPDTHLLERRKITQVEVRVDDGRTISNDQRRKIFALIRDITDYISAPGETKRKKAEKETLQELQLLFLIDYADTEAVRYQLTQHYCKLVDIELFSLSSVDMTTARDFIDWLVELCVIHGIPCIDTLLNRCEDIGRYLYACVANRRCAICGKRADIHEYDRVGSGRNRRTISHLGQRVQPLCREHHCEVDSIGQQTFDRKYHLETIRLDENLCKILKWRV